MAHPAFTIENQGRQISIYIDCKERTGIYTSEQLDTNTARQHSTGSAKFNAAEAFYLRNFPLKLESSNLTWSLQIVVEQAPLGCIPQRATRIMPSDR